MTDQAQGFVQYKGTDICLDFTCGCGAEGHFDGYFAYAVECGKCHQTWVLPDTFWLTRLDQAATHSQKFHAKGVPVVMDE